MVLLGCQLPLPALAALRSLRGNDDVGEELKELQAEQAAVQGKTAKAPWELFQIRDLRWQLFSVVVLSSAMQLCGNDSVSSPRRGAYQSGQGGGTPPHLGDGSHLSPR